MEERMTPFAENFVYCWFEDNVGGIKVGHGEEPALRAKDYAHRKPLRTDRWRLPDTGQRSC
jgi:hypothetical protein